MHESDVKNKSVRIRYTHTRMDGRTYGTAHYYIPGLVYRQAAEDNNQVLYSLYRLLTRQLWNINSNKIKQMHEVPKCANSKIK